MLLAARCSPTPTHSFSPLIHPHYDYASVFAELSFACATAFFFLSLSSPSSFFHPLPSSLACGACRTSALTHPALLACRQQRHAPKFPSLCERKESNTVLLFCAALCRTLLPPPPSPTRWRLAIGFHWYLANFRTCRFPLVQQLRAVHPHRVAEYLPIWFRLLWFALRV